MTTLDRAPENVYVGFPAINPGDSDGSLASVRSLDPEDAARVITLAGRSLAAETLRGYRIHLEAFRAWCEARRYSPMPARPETVAAYLAHLAHRAEDEGGPMRPGSIKVVRSAIGTWHSLEGQPSPTTAEVVRRTMAGIMRELQAGRVRRAHAATGQEILAMTGVSEDAPTLAQLRNAALILCWYGAALRVSELVARDVEDVERRRGVTALILRHSKGNQTGQREEAELPAEAALALDRWLVAAGIRSGPIFRPFCKGSRKVRRSRLSDDGAVLILRECAAAAGLGVAPHDPQWSGHSPRRGAATELDANGASEFAVRDLLRHKSLSTTGLYVDRRVRLVDPSGMLGLAVPGSSRYGSRPAAM